MAARAAGRSVRRLWRRHLVCVGEGPHCDADPVPSSGFGRPGRSAALIMMEVLWSVWCAARLGGRRQSSACRLAGKAGQQAKAYYRQSLVPTMMAPLDVVLPLLEAWSWCLLLPPPGGPVLRLKTHDLLERAAAACASLHLLGGGALKARILFSCGSSICT